MIINDLITNAYKLFNEPSGSKFDQDNRQLALFLANIGYKEICRETKCSRTETTISTIADTREYLYPSGFVALRQVRFQNEPLDPIYIRNITNLTGVPQYYYLEVDKIGFDPIPNQAYSIDLTYFNGPTADVTLLDSPTLIPASWHHVISYFLAYQISVIDKGDQSQSATKWKGLYEAELTKMKNYYNAGNNADRVPSI